MDFGSVMNQVRAGGEGTGVLSPPGGRDAAGDGISSGGGGHAWHPSGDGVVRGWGRAAPLCWRVPSCRSPEGVLGCEGAWRGQCGARREQDLGRE